MTVKRLYGTIQLDSLSPSASAFTEQLRLVGIAVLMAAIPFHLLRRDTTRPETPAQPPSSSR